MILTHTSLYKRQEESSGENKKYSVSLNSASMNDRKSSSNRFCATYFVHENEGASGHFENWLRSDVTDFQLNAYEPTNHEKILERWPTSKHLYTKGQQLLLKAVKQDRNATELDELDRYRLLLWAINVARQRDVRMKKKFQPMLAPIEGNNRTGAHTYILLGAVYNANDDLMRCGTLTTKWIVDNIETEGTTRKNIANRYKNINLHDLTKRQIMDSNSGFNKEFVNMTMVWGKSKNEIDDMNIDINEVEQIDVRFSENRMTDKQNAITPPVTRQLSRQAQIYLDMMTDLAPVPSNESYTFSANASENGKLYVHFQQDPIKIDKTITPPPQCEVFSSEAWTQLIANPNETNLRNHMNSIEVGSTFSEQFQPPMKQGAKKRPPKQTRLVHTGKTKHPPFLLDRYNLFDRVGEIHKRKKEGKKSSDCTKNTEAARKNEMGLGHEPLGLEELMKAHFISLLLPTLCKAYYSIPLKIGTTAHSIRRVSTL